MKTSRLATMGLSGVIFLTAASARGEIITSYTDLGYFSYRVTGLQDFDQRRCDPWGVNCLPGNGNYFCVPTATADLTAYMANHGFPEIPPGVGNWQHSSLYQDATEVIRDFGERMGTGADHGTNHWDWYMSLVGLPLPPFTEGIIPTDKFTVSMYTIGGTYAPRLQNVAQTAIHTNGLVAICHGWYDTYNFGGDLYIVRDGGHCRAVRAIERQGGDIYLETRDPWTDADVLGQSIFSTSISAGIDIQVCTGVPPFCNPRDLTNLVPDWAPESTRFLDRAVHISPKLGYSWDNTADQLIVINPGYLTYTGPIVSYYPMPAEPLDLVIAPDLTSFFVAGDGEIGVIDVMDDDFTSFVTPSVQMPMAIAFNRQRNLYVLDEDGAMLILIDADSDPPAELAAVTLPEPCDALAPDDVQDEVVLLSRTGSMLVRLPWDLAGTPHLFTIPPGLPLAGDLHMAVHPADGSVIVCSSSLDGLMKLEEDPAGGPLIATTFAHPELHDPWGMDVDDAGLIYVSVEGEIKVFAIDALNELQHMPEAPLAGMDAGRLLKVTHSRTNYDEAIHGLPEWRDELPVEDPVEIGDCVADIEPVDGDGVVDVSDLLSLLAAWGPCPACPADINGDGVVDVLDLLEVLAAWGPCL